MQDRRLSRPAMRKIPIFPPELPFGIFKSDESRVRRQPGTIEIFKAARSYRTSPGQRENRSSPMDICASLPELVLRGGTELFSFAAANTTNTALDCPP